MSIKKSLIFLAVIAIPVMNYSQIKIEKIEPPNWWIGMKYNKIQLMIYGENLNDVSASFNTNGITIHKVNQIQNSSYCFIDIEIAEDLTEDKYELTLMKEGDEASAEFPIFYRNKMKGIHQGFSSEDAIYLIMPDRFSNGDVSNDNVDGYTDKLNRNSPIGRHGGDIAGIINQLDYLNDLGVTALWINPLVENNCRISYHGYAATDFYITDKRFGTNVLYKNLVEEAHKKGLKIILDHVSNHCSIDHPWIKNLPMPDWINGTVEDHLPAMHHKMIYSDIHADSSTMKNVSEGWFVDDMPDLNQKNPFVSKYIIQNTIWWIEFSGLDGIREDTYPYVDQKFTAEWCKTILNEYPDLNIVGEVWTGNSAFLADYQAGNKFIHSPETHLPSVTDFDLRDSYYAYLSGKGGLYNIYETLAEDFIYPDPDKLVTFIDNHDLARAMFYADGDKEKFKIALALLFTLRGIPQMLYATEIGMVGGEDHGSLRSDFPGGFPCDSRNAFSNQGRTESENEIYNFIKKLLEIRKKYPELSHGKLVHFPPERGVYIFFKILNDEKTMIVVNNNDYQVEFKLKRFSNYFRDVRSTENLITEEKNYLPENGILNINSKTVNIWKLKN